jgi:hypothetical protein
MKKAAVTSDTHVMILVVNDKSVGDQFKGLLALQEKVSSDSCRCRIRERELASCTYWST